MELFIQDSNQCPREVWEQRLDEIRNAIVTSDKASLRSALENAIRSRIPEEKCALLLSGGVDSSYLALKLKEFNADFTCYTIGIEGSPDLDQAIALAKQLSLKHVHKTLTLDEVDNIMKSIAPWYLDNPLLKEENLAVLFGVAAVEYAAAELIRKDDIKIVFGGLGSEEIFAGYKRHEDSDDINEECWAGLQQMWLRDLVRDCTLAKKFDLEFRTPFLDKDVIKAAMGIPSELKIKDDIKKFILREIAFEDGLPEQFAFRKKLGAQYGSKMDKAITKLTKRAGLKFKADYLSSLKRNPF